MKWRTLLRRRLEALFHLLDHSFCVIATNFRFGLNWMVEPELSFSSFAVIACRIDPATFFVTEIPVFQALRHRVRIVGAKGLFPDGRKYGRNLIVNIKEEPAGISSKTKNRIEVGKIEDWRADQQRRRNWPFAISST